MFQANGARNYTLTWENLCCRYFLWSSPFSQQIEIIIIYIFLSKGCSGRSRNIWPWWAKRFSRRPWPYRRTWSTRCKGNTEDLSISLFSYHICQFFYLSTLIICSYPFPMLTFVISSPKGLTGTPGVQGAEGKPGPLVGHSP